MHLSRVYKFGTTDLPPLQHAPIPCAEPGCHTSVPRGARTKCPVHRRRAPMPVGDHCTADECPNPPICRTLCMKHYYRLKRTGTTTRTPIIPIQRRRHTAGYVLVHLPTHPLRDHHGYVYEHRAVLFAALGAGSHPCHHCGKVITWGSDLQADHLDYDRANNALSNLVPSCHRCNTRRARHRNQFSAPREVAQAGVAA